MNAADLVRNIDNTFTLLEQALTVHAPAEFFFNEHRAEVTHLIAEPVDGDFSVAVCGAVTFVLADEPVYDLCQVCVNPDTEENR